MEPREQGGLRGATFTEGETEDVRLWVESLSDRSIVASPTRLYLPVGSFDMVAVELGDTVWFDPELPGPNAFSVERA